MPKVAARYKVRSADRSPPPASPTPVFTAREEETAVMESEIEGVTPPEETTWPLPPTDWTSPKELVARLVKVCTPLAVAIERSGPEVAKVWVLEVEPFKEVTALLSKPSELVATEVQVEPLASITLPVVVESPAKVFQTEG